MNTVFFKNLGIIDFKEAWEYQELLLASLITKKRNKKKERLGPAGYLIFCQHPHVYTLGKSGKETNLLLNSKELSSKGASFYKINRGGDITYHGPGQLVVYPIFDLDYFFTDIHKYLRYLEDVVIDVLLSYGVESGRVDGSTGVWVECNTLPPKKICAMGVRASRWVTMHGLAFNANVNLDYFNNIVPCGIIDKGVTSLEYETSKFIDFNDLELRFAKAFSSRFNIKLKNNDVKK